MAAPKYISMDELVDFLRSNSLIIVSSAEFEANNLIKRKKLMKRKSLSLKEIIDAKFFPIKDTQTLIAWCENGKIKPDEWYQETNGRKQVMILTQAIKRLGYDD